MFAGWLEMFTPRFCGDWKVMDCLDGQHGVSPGWTHFAGWWAQLDVGKPLLIIVWTGVCDWKEAQRVKMSSRSRWKRKVDLCEIGPTHFRCLATAPLRHHNAHNSQPRQSQSFSRLVMDLLFGKWNIMRFLWLCFIFLSFHGCREIFNNSSSSCFLSFAWNRNGKLLLKRLRWWWSVWLEMAHHSGSKAIVKSLIWTPFHHSICVCHWLSATHTF